MYLINKIHMTSLYKEHILISNIICANKTSNNTITITIEFKRI
jgi:hypothetical protein